ncbi:L10-interacting MYB domain-containing protein-like [Triticum dicoccoides]|uniref:L10-interacting MYB domain-containing protein-like n=1 Tax=Triticum dicoccoides TaxID=85692 RepID=UPI001890FB8D|nr:L10-interacting MYB domain-containing protein-like [Triticum dicoccoides]
MSGAAEWSVENTQIICELFAEQVNAGNRPGNYLTPNAFDEVGRQFKMRTGLDYTYTQLKNKWDKLKGDFSLFKKLKFRETGAGWDYVNNTVSQDDEWWKKAKIDIKGCGKFKKKGLANEQNLRIIFGDITTDGTDHWNPSSGIPPPSSAAVKAAINVDDIEDLDLDDTEEQTSQATPTSSKVRLGIVIPEKKKKPKTAQVMCEQVTRIGDIAEASHSSFQSFMKQDEANCVTSVMDEVIAYGATVGTGEFFMASELFVKRAQREMFLYIPLESRKSRTFKNKVHWKNRCNNTECDGSM